MLRKNLAYRWVTIFSAVVVLTGCASQKPFVPSQEERLASAAFAINENTRLQAIVNECRIYAGDTERLSGSAQASWWERNWPFVYAADQEFVRDTQERQRSQGREAGLLFGLKFIMESEALAAEEAKKVPRATPNQRDMCSHLLASYHNGDHDISLNKRHHLVLQYLREKYGPGELVPYPVPSLKTNYRAKKKIGRSYYKAEQLIADNWCPRVQILNLKDLWPQELYGAYCDSGAMYLVACDWGSCQVAQDDR